jgi:hypothetical protein
MQRSLRRPHAAALRAEYSRLTRRRDLYHQSRLVNRSRRLLSKFAAALVLVLTIPARAGRADCPGKTPPVRSIVRGSGCRNEINPCRRVAPQSGRPLSLALLAVPCPTLVAHEPNASEKLAATDFAANGRCRAPEYRGHRRPRKESNGRPRRGRRLIRFRLWPRVPEPHGAERAGGRMTGEANRGAAGESKVRPRAGVYLARPLFPFLPFPLFPFSPYLLPRLLIFLRFSLYPFRLFP